LKITNREQIELHSLRGRLDEASYTTHHPRYPGFLWSRRYILNRQQTMWCFFSLIFSRWWRGWLLRPRPTTTRPRIHASYMVLRVCTLQTVFILSCITIKPFWMIDVGILCRHGRGLSSRRPAKSCNATWCCSAWRMKRCLLRLSEK
jgi:hypothetical protein